MSEPTGIESRVCADIALRQSIGIKKYGITLEENTDGRAARIRHAYEEALDLAIYLKWELEKADAGEQNQGEVEYMMGGGRTK